MARRAPRPVRLMTSLVRLEEYDSQLIQAGAELDLGLQAGCGIA
jgi:hypothetical protein